MRFKEYLNEKKELTGNYNKDKILKQMDKFKKDIKRLTKIFRSLDENSSPREWKSLYKYYKKYQENFDNWIFKDILYKKSSEVETWEETQLREKAWKALMQGINRVFKEGLDIDTNSLTLEIKDSFRNREKSIRRYNNLLKDVWKAIEELVESEAGSIERIKRIESFNYAGVNITVDYADKNIDEIKKWIPRMEDFLKNLKGLLKRVKNKGLGILLNDLKVKLTLEDMSAAGLYDLYTKQITMTIWSFSGDTRERVFFHELAHRYYYEFLSDGLQEKWSNAIQETYIPIEQKDIQEFVNKYYPFDAIDVTGEEAVKDLLMANEETVNKIAIYGYLIDNFPFQYKRNLQRNEDVKAEILEYYKSFVGKKISSQFISGYANTNTSEAWAEAVAIWIQKGMSQLPPKVRYLMKSIFSDMGVRINESKLVEYLNENLSTENMDELSDFILGLNLKRKPKVVNKADHTILKEIKNLLSDYKELKKRPLASQEIKMLEFKIKGKLNMLRMTKNEIQANYKSDDGNEIKTKTVKYLNESSISNDKFKKSVKNIEEFLSELKGYHKKPIKKLVIRFVDSTRQKSIASYKEQQDVLQINAKRTGNTKEEYGSLRYIILHELGHRYLKQFPQTWNYDDTKWITTKYSRSDSFTGEEKFAELFAMSHWKNKYKQFEDKIIEFEKRITS